MGNTSSQKEVYRKEKPSSERPPISVSETSAIKQDIRDSKKEDQSYYNKSSSCINTQLNSYQYFRQVPTQHDTTNKFGINTTRDNKFSKNLESLYEDELNYRTTVDCSREIPYTREELDTELTYNNRNSNSNSNSNIDSHYVDRSINDSKYNQPVRSESPNTTVPTEITITRDNALIIRDNKYLTNLEKRIMIMNNILISDIDPLDIQKTDKLRLPRLIEKYTSLRNIYHPDKSRMTSNEMFITINSALEKLKYIQKSTIIEKDFNQLKTGYDNYNHTEKKKPNFINSGIKSITPEKFNEFYEKHKYNDIYEDGGYGDIMVDGGIREDIDIEPITVTENNTFLDQFEKSIPVTKYNKIIEYRVPEPCNIDYNCSNICSTKSEFTGKSSSISYYDYKNAFEPIDIDRNAKINNKSYEEYSTSRKTDTLDMTDDKKRIIEQYETKLTNDEKNRQNNLTDYMRNIEIYNNKLNKLTLEN